MGLQWECHGIVYCDIMGYKWYVIRTSFALNYRIQWGYHGGTMWISWGAYRFVDT